MRGRFFGKVVKKARSKKLEARRNPKAGISCA